MADFGDWIGRQDERADVVDPGLLARFAGTIDLSLGDGTLVPQGLHWCLAPPYVATSLLGPDGHPRRDAGSFLPPIPLPRRMWASSEVSFLAPLRVDERVRRTSRLAAIKSKTGASGALVFVDVDHEWTGDAGPLIRERQTIVYRQPAAPEASSVPPPLGPDRFRPASGSVHRVVTPSEALLFRYSALTFNSHRIHYDRPYAVEEEGYRGLVVHGPLTATLLLDLARRAFGDQPLTRFTFRGISPAMCGEPLHLVLLAEGETCELGAFADDGRQVMAATGVRRT
jgi:3-methylfumaryl-CoA hydratase